MSDWKFYLSLIVLCLVVQGFFAMVEMASVSFNKVRLQYYVMKSNRRAVWLSYLLNHPALLFGTSLIGVNLALQIGSESARRFYESVGLSPDLAPLTQVIIVILVAELSPLFAGRRYAENVVMLGIPLFYFSSLVLRPVIWALELICSLINRIFNIPAAANLYLSRDELQKILEEQEVLNLPENEFNTVVSNIFSLKNKTAKELMKPLHEVVMIPSIATVHEMRSLYASNHAPYIPIYHKTLHNIVAIAIPRDLLRFSETERVKDHARPPWFITENNSILQILKQFRNSNRSIAVVLNEAGLAVGILTLDEITDEIFGRSDTWESFEEIIPRTHHVVIDRTLPGDMKITDFNAQFSVHLPPNGAETLEELITQKLGHPPAKNESVRIDQFLLTVEEASLLGAKMISIRTIY